MFRMLTSLLHWLGRWRGHRPPGSHRDPYAWNTRDPDPPHQPDLPSPPDLWRIHHAD